MNKYLIYFNKYLSNLNYDIKEFDKLLVYFEFEKQLKNLEGKFSELGKLREMCIIFEEICMVYEKYNTVEKLQDKTKSRNIEFILD